MTGNSFDDSASQRKGVAAQEPSIEAQCFFFFPRKKSSPEKIFKILPEKICKCPRKNLENCPRRKNCTREKFSKFAPEKKKPVGEKKITNFPLKIAKNPRKFFDLCPRNPNFNPRKKSFCARENVRVPEKICAKVGEKNKLP